MSTLQEQRAASLLWRGTLPAKSSKQAAPCGIHENVQGRDLAASSKDRSVSVLLLIMQI